MTRKPTWKKAEARKHIAAIAETVAEAFGVDLPAARELDRETRDWCLRFEAGRIWTTCGAARLAVDISPTFAHLYFCFLDVGRAWAELHYYKGDLNPFSGKWNDYTAPPVDLASWHRNLTARLNAVAVTDPAPAEVAEQEAKDAAKAAEWAQWREEMRATKDAPETTAQKLQYIQGECARVGAAEKLEDANRATWAALGLHPHTPGEIATRRAELDKMEQDARDRAQDEGVAA